MAEPETRPTTFELVEGATFTLSDGSAVTVRDNELELSDGRRLPMPAAGETITVERTEKRPDGGTVRIKHTIRLSETPVPAPAADGATPQKTGPDGKGGEGGNCVQEEEIPAIDADEIQALPEAPPAEPEKSKNEGRPLIMGLNNRSKGSLRAMLWGSIPEGDDVTTYSPQKEEEEEDPKSEPKSLLHPHHSIMEENESEHEEDEAPEGLDASENANESFEFEGKAPKSDDKDSLKDVAAAVAEAADTAGKVTVLAFDIPRPPENSMYKDSSGAEKPAVQENLKTEPAAAPDRDVSGNPEENNKPTLARQGHVPSATDLLKGAPGLIVASVSIPTHDEAPADRKPAESPSDESSGLGRESDTTSPVSSAGSDGQEAAPTEDPHHSETNHELHLKLTPILKSLESKPPASAAETTREEPRRAPSEDRKGTVPPNTPAVTEDRDPALTGEAQEPEVVSVPKVVSYYESITPSKQPWSNEDAPPRVRRPESTELEKPQVESKPTQTSDPDKYIVPKIVNFAVPMQPQKVYLSSQEPEEMENTPIPPPQQTPAKPPQQEPVVEAVYKPEVAHHIQTVHMIPVQTSPAPEPPAQQPEPVPEAPKPDQTQKGDKPKAREYDPALFEHEPKRPLLLTSEATESAPPYEAGVHDSRTLPMDRKDLPPVVTEQPPPFRDEDRADPRDPFLPDNPRPGIGRKDDGWIGTCLDCCCCCWAP